MKVIKMICPNCHAGLELNIEKGQSFCEFCGTRLIFNDENLKTEVNNVNKADVSEKAANAAEYDTQKKEYVNDEKTAAINYVDEAEVLEKAIKSEEYDTRRKEYVIEEKEFETDFRRWYVKVLDAKLLILKSIIFVFSVAIVNYIIVKVFGFHVSFINVIVRVCVYFGLGALIYGIVTHIILLFENPKNNKYKNNPKYEQYLAKRRLQETVKDINREVDYQKPMNSSNGVNNEAD